MCTPRGAVAVILSFFFSSFCLTLSLTVGFLPRLASNLFERKRDRLLLYGFRWTRLIYRHPMLHQLDLPTLGPSTAGPSINNFMKIRKRPADTSIHEDVVHGIDIRANVRLSGCCWPPPLGAGHESYLEETVRTRFEIAGPSLVPREAEIYRIDHYLGRERNVPEDPPLRQPAIRVEKIITNTMDGSSANSQQTPMDYFLLPGSSSGYRIVSYPFPHQQYLGSYSPFSRLRHVWPATATCTIQQSSWFHQQQQRIRHVLYYSYIPLITMAVQSANDKKIELISIYRTSNPGKGKLPGDGTDGRRHPYNHLTAVELSV